jgi:hypothetical protein
MEPTANAGLIAVQPRRHRAAVSTSAVFSDPPPSLQAGKDALSLALVVMRFQGNGFNEQMFGAE